MKKIIKSIATFLIFVLFLLNKTHAQQPIDSSVLNNYPPSVIEKMKRLTEKIDVTPQRQRIIANYFYQREINVANLIKQGANERLLDSVNVYNDSLFKTLLTSQENFDYFTKKVVKQVARVPSSLISVAIMFKTEFGIIDQSVIDQLLVKSEELRRKIFEFKKENPGKYLDTKNTESEFLSNILTNDQFRKVLNVKNKERAKSLAKRDWREYVTRGLDTTLGQGRDSILNDFYYFHLAKLNAYDRYAYDPVKKGEHLKIVAENAPIAMRKLQHARRNPDNDTQGQGFSW